jgi:hypothetical protein
MLTNVVLLIIDDENLLISSGSNAYQIDVILGYPIFKALGVVTFTRDEFLAGEAAEENGRGVRMYMRGLTPAIEGDVRPAAPLHARYRGVEHRTVSALLRDVPCAGWLLEDADRRERWRGRLGSAGDIHPVTRCHEGGDEHGHVARCPEPARLHECRHRCTLR